MSSYYKHKALCSACSTVTQSTEPISYCGGCSAHAAFLGPVKVKITPENLPLLVKTVEQQEDIYQDNIRFTLRLCDDTMWSLVCTRSLLQVMSVPELLCRELNKATLPDACYEQLASIPSHWASKFWNKPSAPSYSTPPNGTKIVSDLRRLLPGLDTIVRCPGKRLLVSDLTMFSTSTSPLGRYTSEEDRCPTEESVERMIVHLNDSSHRWPREDVADWLESLDVDLEFPTDLENLPPAPPAKNYISDGYVVGGYSNDAQIGQYSGVALSHQSALIKAVYEKEIAWHAKQDAEFLKLLKEATPPAMYVPKVEIVVHHTKAGKSYDEIVAKMASWKKAAAESGQPQVIAMQGATYDELSNFSDVHWDSYFSAPPSPLAAKKAHDDQQAELLAKLNKPKRKKGG